MLYLTSISRHTGKCSTYMLSLFWIGVDGVLLLEVLQPLLETTLESCKHHVANKGFSQHGKSELFLKCWVFNSCMLTLYLYFAVGYSLYTENKVIIFSPFMDVCKCIAVGVLYGQESPILTWSKGMEGFILPQLKHRGCFREVKELTQLLGLSRQVSCL